MLIAENVNWIGISKLAQPMRITAKTRYQASEAPAWLTPQKNGSVQVTFDEPQRSVTPGQAVVFYKGELVIGGGTIINSQ